jgi:hypothetical protein
MKAQKALLEILQETSKMMGKDAECLVSYAAGRVSR